MDRSASTNRSLSPGRLMLIAGLLIFSFITFFTSREESPATGEAQHVGITAAQETGLGLQAGPQLAARFGGLDPNEALQELVDQVGDQVVRLSPASASPYAFEFHLLKDVDNINAFALPGGQIFLTRSLLDRLGTEGELAGILAHQVAHVVSRHSAEQIARAKLSEGLTGAVVIAAYNPDDPGSAQSPRVATIISQLVDLKFGEEDELEADFLAVCFMRDAGYDPHELVEVMQMLIDTQPGSAPAGYFNTHPNPENRIERIQSAIQNNEQCP